MEKVDDFKSYKLYQTISTSGQWGNESVLALFVMKFDINVCVFNQVNNIIDRKMNISMILTSYYFMLHCHEQKKFENLQSSDRKIYLFYHTHSYPVTGF